LEREKGIHQFEELCLPISVALIVGNCPNKQSVCTSMNDIHCDQCDYELISVWPPLRSITEVSFLLTRHCTSTEILAIHLDDFMLKIQLIGDLC
jgi:hypothetical protein